MFLYSVWGQVVVPSCCTAVGVFNVLLIMGVNLVGFVLGVDGARYFAHELISGWAGTSCSLDPLMSPLIETSAFRGSFPAWCLCMPVYRRDKCCL
jgi:hypothetical protein